MRPNQTLGAHNAEAPKTIAILGAGFSGLCVAIKLKQAGFDSFTLYEKSSKLGGTWLDNTYPGAECDVPSHLYSFSFELNPNWSKRFSNCYEIRAYLEHCATKYDIYQHIEFNTEITHADFDENKGKWSLTRADGQRLTQDVFISALGQLNKPKYPNIPGLDSFKGTLFHSSRWDHDFKLEGKSVAVIGTGASAIQFIPEIAKQVKQLDVYQRSPNWIVPKPDREYSDAEHRHFNRYPALIRLYRRLLYWQFELSFMAFKKDSWLGKRFVKAAETIMGQHITDPALKQKLTPNYQIGCKRVLISNDYYPAMQRDNVALITNTVTKIDAHNVYSGDGTKRAVDAIILGTGFEATDFLSPLQIKGKNHQSLNQAWKDGAEAYLGITLTGFPNFFMLYGPNTNLGHNSIIVMIETQANYIVQCIKTLNEKNLKYLDVRYDVQQRHNQNLQQDLSKRVWASDCSSWYKTETGKITNNWPNTTVNYWWRTRRPNWLDYHAVPQDKNANVHNSQPLGLGPKADLESQPTSKPEQKSINLS
ncbi:MAG: 4-hydroxyacetophenone monooxygenase [Moraxellaceae bacterium]|nr:MAG: 4-hydroxyacetophenone monooxygenase [Moraxellaceae bacterium]